MRSYFNGSGSMAGSSGILGPPGGSSSLLSGGSASGSSSRLANTPPPAIATRPLPRPGHQMLNAGNRTSSSSLPRSPDGGAGMMLGGGDSSGHSQQQQQHYNSSSGQGSINSQASSSNTGQDLSYLNIYQNTHLSTHSHLYDTNLEGSSSPRHSLGSNNSSNLSSPPSPARDSMQAGSSSYES